MQSSYTFKDFFLAVQMEEIGLNLRSLFVAIGEINRKTGKQDSRTGKQELSKNR